MLTIIPALPGEPCLGLLKMSLKKLQLLPTLEDLLKDLAGKLNSLVMQNSLRLVDWIISDRIYLQKE